MSSSTVVQSWLPTFAILHTLTQTFICMIPYDNKSESMRIYYHDSSNIFMFMIELFLGLGILFISNNTFTRIVLLVILQSLLYFPISMLCDTENTLDYLHLYKRYFEDNRHFMGFVPLMLSFAILPIISKKTNPFQDIMYSVSFFMIFVKMITSYEDL